MLGNFLVIDVQDFRQLFLNDKFIGPDDEFFLSLHGALILIRGLGNFFLWIAAVGSIYHAAHCIQLAEHQSRKLKALKAHRSNEEVRRRLDALKKVASQEPVVEDDKISSANSMPYIIDAVRAYATVGEI